MHAMKMKGLGGWVRGKLDAKLQQWGATIMRDEECTVKRMSPTTLSVTFNKLKPNEGLRGIAPLPASLGRAELERRRRERTINELPYITASMQKLAERLQTRKDLAGISLIIADPDEPNPPFRQLDRERFLERFGPKEGNPDRQTGG